MGMRMNRHLIELKQLREDFMQLKKGFIGLTLVLFLPEFILIFMLCMGVPFWLLLLLCLALSYHLIVHIKAFREIFVLQKHLQDINACILKVEIETWHLK